LAGRWINASGLLRRFCRYQLSAIGCWSSCRFPATIAEDSESVTVIVLVVF
jgi:hypothetical protein